MDAPGRGIRGVHQPLVCCDSTLGLREASARFHRLMDKVLRLQDFNSKEHLCKTEIYPI